MKDKKLVKMYMGMIMTAVLLGGCGSSGGSTAATTAAAETTVAETTAAKEETTDAGQTEATAEATTAAGEAETTAAETAAAPEAAEGGSLAADIYDQITSQVELNVPMIVPDDFISNYYGLDVSVLEDYVFSMSEAATSAETVAIMKTSAENKETVRAALQMVIDDKSAEMENYLPDQFDIVSKSSVKEAGDYLYLVISENADAINGIIEAALQ